MFTIDRDAHRSQPGSATGLDEGAHIYEGSLLDGPIEDPALERGELLFGDEMIQRLEISIDGDESNTLGRQDGASGEGLTGDGDEGGRASITQDEEVEHERQDDDDGDEDVGGRRSSSESPASRSWGARFPDLSRG